MGNHTVIFVRDTERWQVTVEPGDSLLKAAHACEAPVQTLCHGIAACILCRIKVVEGADHLSTPGTLEKDKIGNLFHITRERMACQALVSGDVVIEILPTTLGRKKRRRR